MSDSKRVLEMDEIELATKMKLFGVLLAIILAVSIFGHFAGWKDSSVAPAQQALDKLLGGEIVAIEEIHKLFSDPIQTSFQAATWCDRHHIKGAQKDQMTQIIIAYLNCAVRWTDDGTFKLDKPAALPETKGPNQ